MALSDAPRERALKRVKSKSPTETKNTRWSDKQKLEAINAYLALGNLAMASRIVGIPEVTLRVWKTTQWWNEVVEDIKTQERLVLSNKLKNLVEAAHSVVENRLINGDPVVLKNGSVVTVPVKLRDAHRVAVDLLNQKTVVERKNVGDSNLLEGQDAKLEQLAEKFAEFATKKIIDKQRTIDVEDAVVVSEPKENVDDPEVAQATPLSGAILPSN